MAVEEDPEEDSAVCTIKYTRAQHRFVTRHLRISTCSKRLAKIGSAQNPSGKAYLLRIVLDLY